MGSCWNSKSDVATMELMEENSQDSHFGGGQSGGGQSGGGQSGGGPYMARNSARMKRRCFCHDYYDRGIYMLTVDTEGRRPLLGRLVGEAIVKTPLGEAVESCWREIPRHFPEVRLLECVVMPDHFHGLLFVRERMEKHLGEVVRGFKIGCTKAQRGLVAGGPVAGGLVAGHTWPATLFSPGYHDRILTSRGQLETLFRYIRENPRRLAARRRNPDYFTRINALPLGGRVFAAYGNPFLLNRPDRLQVQCSRSISVKALEAERERLLDSAERGAVLVSPCISPGEKAIARAALEEGLPLIAILENGFPPFYKPPGRYFEACEHGLLLLLAPWPHHVGKRGITRMQCLELNAMAAEICGPGAAACDYAGLVPESDGSGHVWPSTGHSGSVQP